MSRSTPWKVTPAANGTPLWEVQFRSQASAYEHTRDLIKAATNRRLIIDAIDVHQWNTTGKRWDHYADIRKGQDW